MLQDYDRQINSIENDEESADYFLQNGHTLFQYYENKNSSMVNKQNIEKIKKNNNTVLSFFSKPEEQGNKNKQRQDNQNNQTDLKFYLLVRPAASWGLAKSFRLSQNVILFGVLK